MSRTGEDFSERVLAQLDRAESKSYLTVDERDNYRLAWLTVKIAFYENAANPYFTAFCRLFGNTPENLQRKVEAYEAFMLRGEPCQRHQALPQLPPKKPVQSVKFIPEEKKEQA